MLTPYSAKERVFCPNCGNPTAYDCTGENDWICEDAACHKRHGFIDPHYERDLQGDALIRLRLENEQLREILRRHNIIP